MINVLSARRKRGVPTASITGASADAKDPTKPGVRFGDVSERFMVALRYTPIGPSLQTWKRPSAGVAAALANQ